MLHLFLGSTEQYRATDDFRLHQAYWELRSRLDTDGIKYPAGMEYKELEPA